LNNYPADGVYFLYFLNEVLTTHQIIMSLQAYL
jgi:hypothetical protein